MDAKECYRLLELKIDAPRAEVDAAYTRLIEHWTPFTTVTGDPATVVEARRMIQLVKDAYQALTKEVDKPAEPPATRPTGSAPASSTKPTLRPLPAGHPALGHQPPAVSPPPPESWSTRTTPAIGATPSSTAPTRPPTLPAPRIVPPITALTNPPVAVSPASPPSAPPPAKQNPETPVEAPKPPPTLRSQLGPLFDSLFPPGSVQRRFSYIILPAGLILILFLGKCAVASSSFKRAPEPGRESEPEHESELTPTGRLLVKSNLADANVEAKRIPAPGEEKTVAAVGTAEQTLPSLRPGKYAVTARADGWPDAHAEVEVEVGHTAEVVLNFKSGSLRLDSDPTGAVVRRGAVVLGRTPLAIPKLPPGECQLSVEYPGWPVASYTTTIADGVESTGLVRLPQGRLTVETTPPGATVLLAKRTLGQTPLTLEHFPVGTSKVLVQAKDFPLLEVTVTMVDRGDIRIHPTLGSAFPALDPVALFRTVWIADDPDRAAPPLEGVSGPYQSQNGIVRNLNRKRLFETWMHKRYSYTAIVKSYDRASGLVEFAEQSSDLSKYRVLAKITTESRNDPELNAQLVKGATFGLYAMLSAVEEPRWPSKVITLELSSAEPLR